MRQYELMVILDPELDDRTVQPSLEKFLTVVSKDGGSVDNVDIWGRRRLAYEIKKNAMFRFMKKQARTDAKISEQELKVLDEILDMEIKKAEAAGE